MGLSARVYEILLHILRMSPGELEPARQWLLRSTKAAGMTSTLEAILAAAELGIVGGGLVPSSRPLWEKRAKEWLVEYALFIWMRRVNRDLGVVPDSRTMLLKQRDLAFAEGVTGFTGLHPVLHPLPVHMRMSMVRWRQRWRATFGKLPLGSTLTHEEICAKALRFNRRINAGIPLTLVHPPPFDRPA